MPLQAHELFNTLNRVSARLNYEQPLQAQLADILRVLEGSHGFKRPHIALFEPETGLLKLNFIPGTPCQPQNTYTAGKGITGQVFSTGKAFIVPSMAKNKTFLNLLFERSQEELESLAFLCVPILSPPNPTDMPFTPREVLGTLGIDSPSESEEELELRSQFLKVVADLIAVQTVIAQNKMQLDALMPVSQDSHVVIDTPFIAQSKKMKRILEQAPNFASTDMPLVIYGEQGTGKECYAKKIHFLSSRKYASFVSFYADSTDEETLMKIFRGYVKNAFPSAVQTKKGIFENTNTGTFYIEYIERLPLAIQELLLSVLIDGTITRIGSTQKIPVNIRFIVSSSKDIEKLAEQNKFNKELALRLNAFNITIPPLRERREDIIPLAEMFLKQDALKNNIEEVTKISYPAIELLTSYYFSGNISELKSSLQHSLENCKDGVLRATDLPPCIQAAASSTDKTNLSLADQVHQFEKELIVDSLVKANGNMYKAAQELKTSYRIINYKIKKYELDAKKYNKS